MMSFENPPIDEQETSLGGFFMPFCTQRLRYLYKNCMVLSLKKQEDEADLSQHEKTWKKEVKKCWHPGGDVVLYLSAKRWDKRMTSESQLEVKRKEPIDARKSGRNARDFRDAPSSVRNEKLRKNKAWQKTTSVVKWLSCQPLGWGAHRTLKIEQYRKTCNGTYYRVGKHVKQFQTK